MRGNNRKSIEKCRKRLPQFTMMNVIDGQAGLVIYSSLIFYSLTIDNILNIIVLLILAGVSIAMLTGNNGILTQASKAKENTAKAEEDENNKLDANNDYINEQTGKSLIIPGEQVKETKKNNYVDINGDKATIPQGFTVSGKEDEQIIANGLVIYDIPSEKVSEIDWNAKNDDGSYKVQTEYNQFVWIPVVSEKEYHRDFSYPSSYDDDKIDTTPANSTFTDTGYLPTGIQPIPDNETNNETAERTAVLKYNGFYIARYETGIENSKPVSKQNVAVYTNKTQTEFKTIAKSMYGDSSVYVKSAMCSGIQWDMVMKFVDKKTDGNGNTTFDVRKYEPTRHTVRTAEAGKNLADKVQNIYDLEGNVFEYVAEKNNTSSPFVTRGGWYFRYSDCVASERICRNGEASIGFTFRSALYIK